MYGEDYTPLDNLGKNAKVHSQQSFVLHPLPLLNISDYYTRSKSSLKPCTFVLFCFFQYVDFCYFIIILQLANLICIVIGGLMGTRNYKQVTVFISFELLLKDDDLIDSNYLKKKLELCK